MAIQQADDAAKGLRNVWLGPDVLRFPFDARFSAWGFGVVSAVGIFVLAWLVVPFPAVACAVAWFGSAFLNRAIADSLGTGDRVRWGLFAVIVAFMFLLSPGLMISVLPMPFWLAAVAAPALAIMLTRTVMPYVDHNTPVRSWMWLAFVEADSPRPRRDPAHFTVHHPTQPEPVVLSDLDFARLAVTGGPMGMFQSAAKVNAKRLLPNQEDRLAAFTAWLDESGYTYTVNDGGSVTVYDKHPDAMIECNVLGGHWAFFTPGDDGTPASMLATLPDVVFREHYVRIGEDGGNEQDEDSVIRVGSIIPVGHNLGVEPPYVDVEVIQINSEEPGSWVISGTQVGSQ